MRETYEIAEDLIKACNRQGLNDEEKCKVFELAKNIVILNLENGRNRKCQ